MRPLEVRVSSELLEPDSIEPDFVPVQRDVLSSVEIDGEGLLFDEDRGAWHYLNPLAQIVWSCCDGSGTVAEISADMSDVFNEDYETVLGGVLNSIRQLGRNGLLAGVAGPEIPANHSHDHSHEDSSSEDGHEPRFLPVPASS